MKKWICSALAALASVVSAESASLITNNPVRVGVYEGDGTGDKVRNAFIKVNDSISNTLAYIREAPYTTLDPTNNLKDVLAGLTNGQTLMLGPGLYTVSSAFWLTNVSQGQAFPGAVLSGKTNVTIVGVPGQTIIDGSGAPGESLIISNCNHLKIQGVTFRGYTNDDFTLLPDASLTVIWSVVICHNIENFLFEGNRIENSMDHGITDIAFYRASTNNIWIKDCEFYNIGSWRKNANPLIAHSADGTAVVPTGWKISGCRFEKVHRAIEPYDQPDANAIPIGGLIIQDNIAKNCVEFFMSYVGTTNIHDALVQNNTIINESVFTFRGSNYGLSQIPLSAVGINMNGGHGGLVQGNRIKGSFAAGIIAGNLAMPLDDLIIDGNYIEDINRGDGQGTGMQIGDTADTAAAAISLRRPIIRNNKVARTASTAYLIGGVREMLFENNTSLDCPSGFNDQAAYSAPFRFGVDGYTTSILTNCIIRDNIAGLESFSRWNAYYISSNVKGVFENNLCQSNNNTGVAFITPGGVTNRAGSNVGILGPVRYFSGTVNPGAIPPGSSYTTTISAPGVSTNDIVQVLAPGDLYTSGVVTNITLSGWGSNDVVYVRLGNPNTVGSQTPPSKRYRVTVRQVEAFQQ